MCDTICIKILSVAGYLAFLVAETAVQRKICHLFRLLFYSLSFSHQQQLLPLHLTNILSTQRLPIYLAP